MHRSLYSHIEQQMIDASTSVLRFMPIGLSPEEIYEDLVGEPVIAQAFANAAQYLPPNAMNRRMHLATEEYGTVACNVRLPPTEKYPTYLLPQLAKTLTRESKLSRALALPLRVARDWAMLARVFLLLANEVEDVRAVACLMPWIRELIAEWERVNPRPRPPYKFSKDRREINREVDAILDERPPRQFPRLTDSLNIICLSGKALFSQYRMLTSCTNPVVSPVIVDRQSDLPDWMAIHLADVLEDWRDEQAEIMSQEGNDMIKKRQR